MLKITIVAFGAIIVTDVIKVIWWAYLWLYFLKKNIHFNKTNGKVTVNFFQIWQGRNI